MDLNEILAGLREVDSELSPEEQADARKGLLAELLASGEADIQTIAAAVHEKSQAVDPSSGDVSEEALEEFALLADVSEAISARTEAIQDEHARQQRAAHAAKLAEKIASVKLPDATAQPTADEAPSVTASGTALPSRSGQRHQTAARTEKMSLVAASDLPGFFSGQAIHDMRALTAAVIARAGRTSTRASGRNVPLVSFTRHVPDSHLIQDGMQDWQKMEQAANERTLPGGSLAASMLKRGTSLTASTPIPGLMTGYAWCAPMEIQDELCPIEGSLDGLLDLPTIVTSRGGVMWPATPDYTGLYEPFCFSDEDVSGGYPIEKPCVELPCPEGWEEAKLQGCSLCLETGIIQSRVAPEQVQRALTEMLIAHQHHLNRAKLQAIVDSIATESGGHTDLTAWGNHGPGLIESLLSFIELQVTRMRERRKLAFNTTLEAIFPSWVLPVLRADLSKKNAIAGRWAASDQDVINYLLTRGIRPQFIRGWQDELFTDEAVITQWPTQVSFLIYQAGAFVAVEGPSVQLEMVHDKALLQRNREIRLFAEDLYTVARRCGQAASFTVPLCPNGVSGGQEVIECSSVEPPSPAQQSRRVAPARV